MASFLKKIKRINSPRQKQNLLFLALAVVMFAITLGLLVYNLTFLVSNLNQALGSAPEPTGPQGFDIQGFEKLQLINK